MVDKENVQLCVYVDGNCVVDLDGTAIGDKDVELAKKRETGSPQNFGTEQKANLVA